MERAVVHEWKREGWGEVFRRQLQLRRKTETSLSASKGRLQTPTRPRVKPVHIETQWESPRGNRDRSLCV